MNILQNVIFPNNAFNCPYDMYLRFSDLENVYFDNHIELERNTVIESNTFYNSFSLSKWTKVSDFEDISLNISGNGKFFVQLVLHNYDMSEVILNEKEVELSDDIVSLSFVNHKQYRNGILSFRIKALSFACIQSIQYVTQDEPSNTVKLGIVVTHFNRQKQVNSAVARIQAELLSDSEFSDQVALFVVDNSKNSGIESGENLTVIPNKNLGGSGGFTRGLLELVNSKDYTHCLFMDDDASCEIESIKRTIRILKYTKDEKLAVVGALLRELEPARLYEKGAVFDGVCKPLKSGLLMTDFHHVMMAEFEETKPNYGAWWYFCFPINAIDNYPIPFFVRGDDISFSLSNQFNLLTMNGIASFGDDFGLKSGPLPIYLDLRSHLVEQIQFLNAPRKELIKNCMRFVFAALFSYNYGSAKALCQAIRDFMSGPQFFIDNMDMQARFKMNAEWSKNEKLQDVVRSDYKLAYRNDQESHLRRLFRIVTMNGYLLPDFLMKDEIVYQNKGFRASFREVFRFKKIYYEYTPLMKGYVAERNKKEFLSIMKEFSGLMIELNKRYPEIKADYQENLPKMMTKGFWDSIYNDEKGDL